MFSSSKNENIATNFESTNITLLKPSGKLLDAVSAAALNSVEDGLGPVVVPITNKGLLTSASTPRKNVPEKISIKANNKLNKLLSSYGFGDDSDAVEPVIKNSKNVRGSSPDNRRSLHVESKKNDEYNINNSFNSSSLSSFTALKKKSSANANVNLFKANENRTNELNKEKIVKPSNTVNDPRLIAKSSLGTVDTNIVKNQAPILVNNKKINQNTNDENNNNNNNANLNDANMDRPPGRLNNYDSDTNTFSGDNHPLGIGSNFRKSNNEMLNKKLNKGKKIIIFE